MFTSSLARKMPTSAASRHIGTIKMIDSGNDQLSYCEGQDQEHEQRRRAGNASFVKMSFDARSLLIGQFRPFGTHRIRQAGRANAFHHGDGLAELTPGADAPLSSADG